MATLVAYIDDSGDLDEKKHNYLTLAGYSFVEGETKRFEKKWGAVLKNFDVPYLHMREFCAPRSPYRHLRHDAEREAAFFMMLVNAIQHGADSCVSSSVRLADLKGFNDEHGLGLDPYSVAIYGCFLNFALNTPQEWQDELTILFDNFDRSNSRATKAEQYYISDQRTAGIRNIPFSINMLPDNENFKTNYQLQAADFLAWETRKNLEDNFGFMPSYEARKKPALL